MTQTPSREPRSGEDALRRERLDAALHEWWSDDHGDGSKHICRPVPSEDEFLAAAARNGITVAASPSPDPDLREALERELRTHFHYHTNSHHTSECADAIARAALERTEP